MNIRAKKGHWRQLDFRYDALKLTIKHLEASIMELEEFMNKTSWYDGMFFREDAEPIYGLMFIAFQNYINSSIFDLDGDLSKRIELYNYDSEITNGVTRIQLIIALANYIKHRDDSRKLHAGTSSILEKLSLKFGSDYDIDSSPIFVGLRMLDPEWDMSNLLGIVKGWRENIWSTLVK